MFGKGPAADQSWASKWCCLRLCESIFKSGKKAHCATQQLGEWEEWGRALQAPGSVKKEGERCSRRQSRSPLQPVVRTMVKQAVPLQPMEYHGGARFHVAAYGGDHSGAGGPAPMETAAWGRPLPEQILGQTCSPWRGDHTGGGDLAGAAASGGPRLEQFAPEGWTPWYRPISGAVLEELLPVGSPRRISSTRTASRGRDPTAQGTRVTEKERRRRSAIDWP